MQDTAGTAFDALDRALIAYRNAGNGSLMPVTSTYDGTGNEGLLSQRCNANAECQSFTYDVRNQKARTTFTVASSSTQTFAYDEDGRLANATNSNGSINDVYDADGRKSSRNELVTSAPTATITYHYAGDGQRTSLDVLAGTQNLPSELAYTYRPDEIIRSLTIAGSSNFTFAYTGGRRLTSRSDSTGQTADTFTYSAPGSSPTSIGRVLSTSSPGFNEPAITYNAEGGQVGGGFSEWNGSAFFGGPAINAIYTTRNELVVGFSGGSPSLFANGTQIQAGHSTNSYKTAAYQFNALQGRPVLSNSGNTCNGYGCSENDSGWGWTYDSVGRQTAATFGSNSGSGTTYTNAKSYDAEDHLLGMTMPWIPTTGKSAYSQQLGYLWGPFGHPLQIGSTSAVLAMSNPMPTDFQYDALYWDDDDLLFTMNSSGQIDDIKIADFADYMPGAATPLTVWDRDINGTIYGCHSATVVASAEFNMASACVPGTPTFGVNNHAVGRGGMLTMPKSDGLSDGQNTFQGVRTYDPQAGAWTTPDAFHGVVHDPMTQKPYMWDLNNPYAYSDPSGFCDDDKHKGCMGGVDWNANYNFANTLFNIMSVFLPGPEGKIGGAGMAAGALRSAATDSGAAVLRGAAARGAGMALRNAPAVGSALKGDLYHNFPALIRNIASEHGTNFSLVGGDGKPYTLTQIAGSINGKDGVFEFVVDSEGNLTHQLFKEGGVVNGKPN